MNKLSSGVILALALSLTACAGGMADNRTLNSVHQPVVSRANYALDLSLTPGGSLPVQQQQVLSEWFDAMDLGYGDRVSLDNPGGSLAARSMVEAVASRYGLEVADAAPVTTGNIAPGGLRVVVSRSSARVPGCPDWAGKQENNFNNATSRNFGCALNSNLAAMIADPEDLVHGKESDGTADVSHGAKAAKKYREAAPGSGSLGGSSATGGGE
ncbi:CpaD family pilus assembly protein [Sphingorhabdus sp. Alg239-R122]|uniref:CpaD family pilus assembly protein n=1 Tax=Sphingorhabdus sp. Alg239-R122 TaxID=2305989 RepID=UPI001F07B26F|nr:CpaD family pilus assembly protein [Sphingorhabdus sp. Alg239-R122]